MDRGTFEVRRTAPCAHAACERHLMAFELCGEYRPVVRASTCNTPPPQYTREGVQTDVASMR